MSLIAAVLGANGYGGSGLIRRLRNHPEITEIRYASRSSAGRPVHEIWPQLAGRTDARFVTPDEALAGADVVFLATPHGATAPWVRAALAAGARVIDLSADSRLDPDTYAEWYGPHPHPDDLQHARYGLVEAYRPDLNDARLVAAPGCNATAASLALLPFAANDAIDPEVVPVVTVVTGASGAGRGTATPLHFSELDANARPYKPAGTHRHLAEIEGNLGRAAEQGRWLTTHGAFRPLTVSFTPQLAPMTRGILATCTFRPKDDANGEAARELAHAYYADEPLVHVQDTLPEVKAVTGSDRTLISVHHDARTGLCTVFAVLDNLGKGAAGQAVQGFNVAFGFPETSALEMEGRWP